MTWRIRGVTMLPCDDIIGKIRTIPPLSQAALQILSIMSRPGQCAEPLMRIIQTDVALTARVLRVVNASRPDGLEPVGTVDAAMAKLGDKVTLGIVLDYCMDGLVMKPLDGYLAGQGRLWEHNLLTALAARTIAAVSPFDLPADQAYTGGILHDVGKSVLSEFLLGSAEEMVQKIDWGVLPDYLAAEEEKLGTNHCIIGAAVAAVWKLPQPLPEIIRHHHHPHNADAAFRGVVYAVHLGDLIAMMMGSGTGCDSMYYKLEPGYRDALGIHKNRFPAIMLRVEEEFEKAQAFIKGGSPDADDPDR